MNHLHWLTAADARARLLSGQLRAEDLVRACLDRITARDATVRAWVSLQPEAAIAQARHLDALRAAGQPLGPLHGIPVGIKDVIATADLPTQHNSPLRQGERPGVDAACVRLLRQAGAVVLGKTDTVEFAATGRRAATCHPLDQARSPGGSSSGSAAAVADGHVPLALSTQTGGSTIRPASYCGVYALKPTWGLASVEGVKTYAPSLDTLGWMARSADDLGLLLQLFEPRSVPPPPPWGGLRLALCRTPMWPHAEDATRVAFGTAEALLRDAGVSLTLLELPRRFAALPALQLRVMHAEGGVSLRDEFMLHGEALEPSLRAQVLHAAGDSRADLCAAWDEAAACRPLWDALASPYDAVLVPSSTGVAPLGLQNTGDLVFNGIWTLLHAPCVNLPGFSGPRGMPVGLTLVGRRFSDAHLLAVAASLSALFAVRKPAAADTPRAVGDA